MEELDELCAVDEGAAVFYARNFFASTTGNVEFLPEVKSVFPVTDENGKVHMYIVNFEPNGFVVTNADIRNTPIFAYSEESDFIVEKEEDLPAALLGLMSNNIDYSKCNEIVFRDSLTDENYIYRQRFIYDIYPKKQ